MIALSEHFNRRKLIKFTLPTIIMMIFTSVYGVVDGLFISNVAGSDAFAAVNLIMPALMVLGAVGFMIGTGGSALVSKTLGEGKQKTANQYFSMLIWFLIICGVVLTVLGEIFIEPLAALLGADSATLTGCVIYGRVLLVALTGFILQNAFQSFLVVAEKPGMGLKISIASGITNIVLDFLFVYVIRGGVFGAAVATGISQLVGSVIPLVYFIRRNDSPLRMVKPVFDGKALMKSCANGSSEMLTNISMSLVNILYNYKLMQIIGSDGVVAYGIIMYIAFVFVGVYMGYSVGVAPVISYHYGAENTDELKGLFKNSIIMLTAASVILTVVAELSAKVLAGIFVRYSPELLELSATAIRLFVLSYLISGINVFASAFFTALNNGVISALISFLRTFVFQIVMIMILPVFWGANGLWSAIIFAELLGFIVSIICFVTQKNRYKYM